MLFFALKNGLDLEPAMIHFDTKCYTFDCIEPAVLSGEWMLHSFASQARRYTELAAVFPEQFV